MGLANSILYDTIYHCTPIILCVLGGAFAYKANVLNIALEGMMLCGAFIVMLVVQMTGNIPLAILLAIAAALGLCLIFSFFGITLNGNVIIIGLGINMFVSSVAGFVLQQLGSSNIYPSHINVSDFKIHIPLIQDIPVAGKILSGHPLITYLSFAGIVVMWALMYKTKLGVYIRVVGENDDAAKSIGLKSAKYKYIAIFLGGFACALAGINLSLERLGLFTNNMTSGRGFIAIAAIYCGKGDPVVSSIYAIVFGLARALSINLSIYAGPAAGLFDVIPYLMMTVVLTLVSVIRNKNNQVRGFRHV